MAYASDWYNSSQEIGRDNVQNVGTGVHETKGEGVVGLSEKEEAIENELSNLGGEDGGEVQARSGGAQELEHVVLGA
ncbi:hypothetical protein B9479_006240 [Cryptococcus floricola]|uniref:Uncharacterized protein n=1 Tax=Cryptococcus floricola TaxID=2591691 RepID=A0A5D3AR32_9TREE|nr:hypothetical protein B9479_006240 [Cryptococcus floricola]